MPRRSTQLTRKSISSFSRFAQAACRSCTIEYVRGRIVSVSSLSPFRGQHVHFAVYLYRGFSLSKKIVKGNLCGAKTKKPNPPTGSAIIGHQLPLKQILSVRVHSNLNSFPCEFTVPGQGANRPASCM